MELRGNERPFGSTFGNFKNNFTKQIIESI
jgi:hypothetical protein